MVESPIASVDTPTKKDPYVHNHRKRFGVLMMIMLLLPPIASCHIPTRTPAPSQDSKALKQPERILAPLLSELSDGVNLLGTKFRMQNDSTAFCLDIDNQNGFVVTVDGHHWRIIEMTTNSGITIPLPPELITSLRDQISLHKHNGGAHCTGVIIPMLFTVDRDFTEDDIASMIGVLMRSVEEKKNPCITINSENDGILGTVTVEPLPENP